VSDELSYYATILFEIFHSEVVVAQAGKRGRPRNRILVVDPDLKYATVHKTRKEGKVIKVERKIVFGSPDYIAQALSKSESNTLNTSFIERTNLSTRFWDAHLTRKL
jgi:hypothetical protein